MTPNVKEAGRTLLDAELLRFGGTGITVEIPVPQRDIRLRGFFGAEEEAAQDIIRDPQGGQGCERR